MASAACTTTATISTINGHKIDGKIVAGGRDAVYVGDKAAPARIPRDEISDIDHPGDTATAIGTLLLGYGVVNIAAGASRCQGMSSAYDTGYCIGVYTPATLGAGMAIWGLAVHSRSVEALKKPPPDWETTGTFFPILGGSQSQPFSGVGYGLRF